MALKRTYFNSINDINTPRKRMREPAIMLDSQDSSLYDEYNSLETTCWQNWSVQDLVDSLLESGLTDIATAFEGIA